MSDNSNIVIAVVVAVGGFLAYRMMNAASGPGEALGAAGQTAGGFLDFGGDIAGGIAGGVADVADYTGGGLADVIRVPGNVGSFIGGGTADAVSAPGDILGDVGSFVGGGTADVIRDVQSPDINLDDFTPDAPETPDIGGSIPGGNVDVGGVVDDINPF